MLHSWAMIAWLQQLSSPKPVLLTAPLTALPPQSASPFSPGPYNPAASLPLKNSEEDPQPQVCCHVGALGWHVDGRAPGGQRRLPAWWGPNQAASHRHLAVAGMLCPHGRPLGDPLPKKGPELWAYLTIMLQDDLAGWSCLTVMKGRTGWPMTASSEGHAGLQGPELVHNECLPLQWGIHRVGKDHSLLSTLPMQGPYSDMASPPLMWGSKGQDISGQLYVYGYNKCHTVRYTKPWPYMVVTPALPDQNQN